MMLTSSFCFGQNLVTNGNFNTYSKCPKGQGRISDATPWLNLTYSTSTNLLSSPDFYHTCSSRLVNRVPKNNVGYQMPHDGNGYAGIFAAQFGTGGDSNVREYISVPLGQTLQNGSTYHVQFYVSLSNNSRYGVTTIGSYFSGSNILPMNGWMVNATPQIVNSNQALMDTANWVLVSGKYTASGGEQYLTIGNFENDANCGMQQVMSINNTANHSYYYIDDVCVSTDSLFCLKAPTDINEINKVNEYNIYPNPTTGLVRVKATGVENIEIRNIQGEQVYMGTATQIDLSSQPNGMYIIKVITNRQSITRKLMKE